MKIVVQVKLLPTPEQASALEATLRAVNHAANDVSQTGFGAHGLKGSVKQLRSLCYAGLKGRGLGAQAAQHVIKRVVDSYTTLRGNIRHGNLGKPGSQRRMKAESKPVTFRADAAHTFDDRCLSWNYDQRTVSIWTTHGRLKNVGFAASPQDLKTLVEHRQGESDLVFRDGTDDNRNRPEWAGWPARCDHTAGSAARCRPHPPAARARLRAVLCRR